MSETSLVFCQCLCRSGLCQGPMCELPSVPGFNGAELSYKPVATSGSLCLEPHCQHQYHGILIPTSRSSLIHRSSRHTESSCGYHGNGPKIINPNSEPRTLPAPKHIVYCPAGLILGFGLIPHPFLAKDKNMAVILCQHSGRGGSFPLGRNGKRGGYEKPPAPKPTTGSGNK
ncbi:hypothetical protein B0T22DRAFT_473267 [Podospora appendiculata]|uniref:Uncharacterized protein n=1 Tax=Podospora appendiculata TaxID=314037 RepID=A0AAE0WZ89_9PEZI|nr:hypothetical protein B0T22DRAFT_473267 [Podospora appendiculata]